MPQPNSVEDQVSVSPAFIISMAESLQEIKEHDRINSPDAVRIQQSGSRGWVQWEYELEQGEQE